MSKYTLTNFKNINGEGVTAKITIPKNDVTLRLPGDMNEMIVIVGNERLMERFKVNLEVNNFRMNMQALES